MANNTRWIDLLRWQEASKSWIVFDCVRRQVTSLGQVRSHVDHSFEEASNAPTDGSIFGPLQRTTQISRSGAAGTFNNWDNTPNMPNLDGTNTWQGNIFVNQGTNIAFKFVADQTWNTKEWGETNQNIRSLSSSISATGTAEFLPGYGMDIIFTNNVTPGIYQFTFNDSNREYSVVYQYPTNYNYSSMAVSFDYNGTSVSYDTTPNMTLVADHVWQADLFVVPTGNWRVFRFVAQNNSAYIWRDLNQTNHAPPITSIATLNAPAGREMLIQPCSNGMYRFTFNETSGVYSVQFLRAGNATHSGMASIARRSTVSCMTRRSATTRLSCLTCATRSI